MIAWHGGLTRGSVLYVYKRRFIPEGGDRRLVVDTVGVIDSATGSVVVWIVSVVVSVVSVAVSIFSVVLSIDDDEHGEGGVCVSGPKKPK